MHVYIHTYTHRYSIYYESLCIYIYTHPHTYNDAGYLLQGRRRHQVILGPSCVVKGSASPISRLLESSRPISVAEPEQTPRGIGRSLTSPVNVSERRTCVFSPCSICSHFCQGEDVTKRRMRRRNGRIGRKSEPSTCEGSGA